MAQPKVRRADRPEPGTATQTLRVCLRSLVPLQWVTEQSSYYVRSA